MNQTHLSNLATSIIGHLYPFWDAEVKVSRSTLFSRLRGLLEGQVDLFNEAVVVVYKILIN